jgi:hypothetical protein
LFHYAAPSADNLSNLRRQEYSELGIPANFQLHSFQNYRLA